MIYWAAIDLDEGTLHAHGYDVARVKRTMDIRIVSVLGFNRVQHSGILNGDALQLPLLDRADFENLVREALLREGEVDPAAGNVPIPQQHVGIEIKKLQRGGHK